MAIVLNSTEREILQRSRRLPEPTDYWKGKPGHAPFCPANILLFHRVAAAQLLGHSPSQHHRFLLIASLGGEGMVGIDGRMHPLRERQSLLVFPFQAHLFAGFPSTRIHWIFVSFEHARDPALESLRNRGGLAMAGESMGHLGDLLRSWEIPPRQQTLPLHLGLWLHAQVRIAGRKHKAEAEKRMAASRGSNLVEQVNHLLFRNRHRPFSIDEMASALGYSGSLLRKRFQEATGRSIGRHAREIRLNHACELLYDTSTPITEISERCGYESLFAFSRAFHHRFGRSPSRYRKERVSA